MLYDKQNQRSEVIEILQSELLPAMRFLVHPKLSNSSHGLRRMLMLPIPLCEAMHLYDMMNFILFSLS
jgi:hypothetical protein